MTRLSIGTWAFGAFAEEATNLEEVFDRVAAMGYDGIELGAFAPHPTPESCRSGHDRRALRSLITDRGLGISAVAASFNGIGFLRTEDPTQYLEILERNLEFCSEVGASRLVVHTVDTPETPYEIGEEVAHRRLIDTWRRGAELATTKDITLAWEFEPCWAFNKPEQIALIAKELFGPGFGVLYDTAHAHAVADVGARHVDSNGALQDGQVEFLKTLDGTIVHVHLLDSDGTLHESDSSSARTTVHVPFGRGNVEFDRVIPALRAAGGQTEWWTVDLCFWTDPWGAAEESRRYAANLLAMSESP